MGVIFPRSENWWIEGDRAYFITYDRGRLFCLDMSRQELIFMSYIPSESRRSHTVCVKFEEFIYCFPGWGHDILEFDIKEKKWNRIPLCEQGDTSARDLGVGKIWIYENHIYAALELQNRIVVFSPQSKTCCFIGVNQKLSIGVYDFFDWENRCFSLNYKNSSLYEWDFINEKSYKYDISNMNESLGAACFDGCNFWLTGVGRVLYRWDIEHNCILDSYDLPEVFGYYNFKDNHLYRQNQSLLFPSFVRVMYLYGNIWLIPYTGYQFLMFSPKNEKFEVLSLENEKEEGIEFSNIKIKYKFIYLYLRKRRFIGIWSVKNEKCIEIDTKLHVAKYIEYVFNADSLVNLSIDNVYQESKNRFEWEIFFSLMGVKKENPVTASQVGKKIYRRLLF